MASISFISAAKLADLLKAADARKDLYVRVLSASRLALGTDPLQPTQIVDLRKEKLVPCDPGAVTKIFGHPDASGEPQGSVPEARDPFDDLLGSTPVKNHSKITRRGGDYWYEIDGHRTNCTSLKELLSGGLLTLEHARPGTIEKLSHVKPRSRRIVAREPEGLFDKRHLAKEYAERLMDGWWYGTNNSALETNTWLERACAFSGLKWGVDFKTNLTITIDDI